MSLPVVLESDPDTELLSFVEAEPTDYGEVLITFHNEDYCGLKTEYWLWPADKVEAICNALLRAAHAAREQTQRNH